MKRWTEWRSDRNFHVELGGKLVLIAERGVGRFLAFGVDAEAAGKESSAESWAKMIDAACKEFACKRSELTLKLLGPSNALDAVETVLQGAGFAVSKKIPRDGLYELRFELTGKRLQVSHDSPRPVAPGKIKVLVVDDSSSICKLLGRIIEAESDLSLVATTTNPLEAEALVRRHAPDVVTLDIHMPDLDGVALLRRLRTWTQVPVLMISSITKEEGPLVFEALDAGAFDYVQKPKFEALAQASPAIIARIKAAAESQKKASRRRDAVVRKAQYSGEVLQTKIVAIGSSTGGTEALKHLFLAMPDQIPPILVVQHIPPMFSDALARRFDNMFVFKVKEAEDGEDVTSDKVLIAPGGRQMRLVKANDGLLRVAISDARPDFLHNPSVDFLFDSVADVAGAQAVGVILTGMGSDGAKGMLKMRSAGAHNIAQDEQSSVIFGMPREAIAAGGTHRVLPLDEIAQAICQATSGKRAG